MLIETRPLHGGTFFCAYEKLNLFVLSNGCDKSPIIVLRIHRIDFQWQWMSVVMWENKGQGIWNWGQLQYTKWRDYRIPGPQNRLF